MNVRELRIRQSITGLIAKTKPNTCAIICSQIPFCCTGFTNSYKLIFINTKQYLRTHISLLGLPLQRVSPNDGNITYHRPVRVLFSLLLFLLSVVKLNRLTALELT